jgi:signal transduction histidine kinase
LACTFSSIDSVPIQLTDGESPVGMRILPTDGEVPISWNALFWLAFLILVLITLWYAADWVSGWHSPVLGNAIFVLLLVIIRWLMLWWEQPSAIYALELFGPTHHATSSLLPSLGDFMLNLIWLLCILVRITRTSLKIETSWVNRILGITVPVLLVWPFHFLLEILVINSSFSLDLNHPFSLTFFSILGLVASFLILFNYYLIYRWLFGLVDAKDRSPIRILPPLILGGIALLLLLGFSERFCVLTLIASGLLGILMLSERWMANRIGIYVHTPKVLVFSLLTCSVLIGIESENEQESRIALARSIDEQQNPITEFLFDELADDLLEDRKLRTALSASPLNAENVLSIIHTKLNYDHWNRYLPIVDIYNDEGGLMVSDRERTGPNFFELQSEYDSSKPTISESLRYVGNWDSEGGYLARLEFSGKRSQKNLILFIRLVPERTDDILGFTDLFVDENISTAKDIQGYSYALYNNGELQEQHGNFAYSLSASEYEKFGSENTFIERDGFSHLISKPLEGRIVVVSQASDPYLEYLTTFSYLFLFYLLCTGIASLFSGRLTIGHKDNRSFRNRINIAMSAVSFISLILIGLLTVFYVIDEYHARNEEMISEKSKSVLIELEHKLRDRQSFEESDQAMLSALLVKFSKVFFTDINLYHLDGHLLATSRPRLFDEGLMAKVIHPTAYTEMRFGRKSSFIQEETIGNLSYLTAYVPFRNEKREVIAFMSLPYFARQYGLQQEIFSLLAALTNIYVFLILISVVLALVISNRITEPLRIIRESLKNLKFDQANRAIEWKSNDEIGELVDEYNRTLNELVQSAELLARSERESAWREMAKQVAHEIKNPLTPMKLSIQMLQRSKNDGAEDLDERIDKVSKTLIEQIDTLSNIATEFSSFAQMPKSNIERINLQLLLESVAELYQNSEVDIRLSIQADRPSIIQADKEQMLRVFNNLIKNGIQAVPEDREPTIVIGLIESEGRWIASIKDNGSGIPEELKDKIFVPNFTTKSSGMGLGLAMVKNIVESVNGKISFNSESGAGTTFYVSLSISDH